MVFLHDFLERSAINNPAKKIIAGKIKNCSYQELNEASAKLAAFLLQHQIQPGERIGIFSAKCVEEIIALFAIMRIGAIFVHINPHFKEEQLSYVVKDCQLKALLVHKNKVPVFRKAFPDNSAFDFAINLSAAGSLDGTKVFDLETILKTQTGTDYKRPALQPDDAAAIIYTSGSTGKPKGIVVTHKIFHDATVASAQVLGNTEEDRLISITPFSFDGALSQLFTMVYAGGSLLLQESLLPKDIVTTMIEEKITGFHAMPSLWRMLMQKHSPFSKYTYPDLRYISIIGEAFPRAELARLRQILNATQFFMMYGTTEAFRSTYLPPQDYERKDGSVGIPFPGVSIRVVDEQGKTCPPGETGEIVHEGNFVSPGYWNDPQRTAQVFKNKALFTGDLGKTDQDGYLYFMGRKDSMLKLSGYRVSPEEIEACLLKIAGIEEALVSGVPDEQNNQVIKAILVSANGENIAKEEVIRHCKMQLPYYMVPKIIEFTPELPKTGTYKLKRSNN